MRCVKPLAHRPEFEGKLNCKNCSRDRLKLMEKADEVAAKQGYEASATGMYLCEEFEGQHLIDRLNICNVCLFIEDEPYNFGDSIKPTSYDGDCDDCGLDSRFYVEG